MFRTMDKENIIDNGILVTGITGSGSSTLINYLCGVKYQLKKDKELGSYFLQPESDQIVPAEVGHHITQQTRSAQLIKSNNFSFVDCPAINEEQKLYDTNGKNLYDSLGVLPIIEKTKNIRALILVVEWSSLTISDFCSNLSKGTMAFRSLSHILNTLIKDPQLLVSNPNQPLLLFAISKLPNPERDEYFDTDELR